MRQLPETSQGAGKSTAACISFKNKYLTFRGVTILYASENIIVLTDFDDCHAHTRKKFKDKVGDPDKVGTACVFDQDGGPVSWRSRSQTSFLNMLLRAAREVVPVTGRTVEKLKAVKVGFRGHAICSFGAVILTPDGQIEPGWHARMVERSREHAVVLRETVEHARDHARRHHPAVSVSLVKDAGLDLFIKVQDPSGLGFEAMHELLKARQPRGWTLHYNENQLCLYPPYLGKRDAAQYYLDSLGGPVDSVIGVGDSDSDLDFLQLCQFVVMPGNSQLFARLTDKK